ncbi:MAG: helix-turn-helix domain-containing protein, partial [Terriglobia bacterium]
MNAYPKELSQHPESEEFEKKSELVPTKTGEMLELIKTIVSMANTRGGKILIGTEGKAIPRAQIQHFDSARLDDKANGYIEPHLGNIRTSVIDGEFVLIEVEKGQNPPYMFKRDGSYHAEQNQLRSVFRRGEILVRHSSKSERAERSDLDRMFSEREQHLFEKVKMIFEAPPDA